MLINQVHTYTFFLLIKIIQRPQQVEIHHVNQSGTHTHTLSLTLKRIQTPYKMEIHRVHQSGIHTHTTYTHHTHSLFNTQDNNDVTVDGDTSCSSLRYIHLYTLYNTQDKNRRHCRWRCIMFINQVHTHINSL